MKPSFRLLLLIIINSLYFNCFFGQKELLDENNLLDRSTYEPPNFLIILSDDVSPEQISSLYGANFAVTPAFNSLAANGLLFQRAYTSTSSCAPARASLLTCRNIWQNEEAGVHNSIFSNTFPTYIELLVDNGYQCGYLSGIWKPGKSLRNENSYGKRYGGYVKEGLEKFLDDNVERKPFHFFITTFDGHAPFENKWEEYVERMDTMNMPPYLPNNNFYKKRLLNANYEIENFDKKIQLIIDVLKERNLYDNTVIIVSSDNGTTLSGNAKGAGAYNPGCRVPLLIHWPKGIKAPGREVHNLVSQMDVSKTLLNLAKIQPLESMTEGESLRKIFYNANLKEDINKYIYTGFERHTRYREKEISCFPIRSIISEKFQYIINLEPERRIFGEEGNRHYYYYHYGNDKIKGTILEDGDSITYKFYESYTKQRPLEELFDLENDPACLNNLAGNFKYIEIKNQLSTLLIEKLKKDNDPRINFNGIWFDLAPVPTTNDTITGFPYTDAYQSPFDRSNYPSDVLIRPWKVE